METKFGQKCIIFDKEANKILVMKRSHYKGDGDIWDFVGGSVDFGEDSKEAIKREALEETGLTLINPQIIDLHSRLLRPDFFFIFGLYYCDHIDGEIKLSHEHTEYRWVSLSEFDTLPLKDSVKYVKPVIMEYLKTVEDYY